MRKNDASRNALKERKKILNDINRVSERERNIEAYNRQQERANKKMSEEQKPPIFFRNRTGALFRGNYFLILFGVILLVLNTIGRIFAGTYWYIIPNLIFLVVFISTLSVIEPIDFSSDNKKYIFPKFNLLYQNLQKLSTPLLGRLGTSLKNKPEGSLTYSFLLTLGGSVLGLLFYNSNFSILGIPFFFIFIVRSFVANDLKRLAKKINLYKYILFFILVINSIISIFWKTPFDYALLIIISFYNTTSIWFKNTYVYTFDELSEEEDYE